MRSPGRTMNTRDMALLSIDLHHVRFWHGIHEFPSSLLHLGLGRFGSDPDLVVSLLACFSGILPYPRRLRFVLGHCFAHLAVKFFGNSLETTFVNLDPHVNKSTLLGFFDLLKRPFFLLEALYVYCCVATTLCGSKVT